MSKTLDETNIGRGTSDKLILFLAAVATFVLNATINLSFADPDYWLMFFLLVGSSGLCLGIVLRRLDSVIAESRTAAKMLFDQGGTPVAVRASALIFFVAFCASAFSGRMTNLALRDSNSDLSLLNWALILTAIAIFAVRRCVSIMGRAHSALTSNIGELLLHPNVDR